MASVKTRIGNMDISSDIRSSLKTLPFRVFQTPFFCLVNFSTGSRTRGYSPFGLPVFQTE
jgi:hypothetical protein